MSLLSSRFILSRFFWITICLLFCIQVVSVAPASAQAAPEEMVIEMVDRLKSERDPSVLLEYVHWDTAFDNFPEEQRREIDVSSPGEFRGYFEGFFRDPANFIQKQMKGRMAGMTPEQQQMMQAQFEQMAASMVEKRRKIDEKMSRAEYKVGQIDLKGNTATVELITSLDGQTRSQSLPLELINGKWYLPTMKFVDGKSASSLPD